MSRIKRICIVCSKERSIGFSYMVSQQLAGQLQVAKSKVNIKAINGNCSGALKFDKQTIFVISLLLKLCKP